MKKHVWLALVLMLMLLVVAGCAKRELPPLEGNQAPDFTLPNLAGEQLRLADLRGKVVLVHFWGTFCPPCRQELPSLAALNQVMAGKPLQLLAIAVDPGGKVEVEAFLKKAGVTLPALLDPQGSVARRYGTTGVPETFIIDQKGVIVKKIVGAVEWNDPAAIGYLNELIDKNR